MSDKRFCDRHGGAWGADPTCERCTYEDGTPRAFEGPLADPGPLGPGASAPDQTRYCFHSDEGFYDRERKEYVLARIVEGEAGYYVDSHYTLLDHAQAAARELNEKLGLTAEDVIDIRSSSMREHLARKDREDADGYPYLAYYRNDLTLGFVWSGDQERPAQVTREMGEPVIDTFHLAIASGKPADVLARFQNACDMWVAKVWLGYMIVSYDDGTVLYWSNEQGWCEDRAQGDVFTEEERYTVSLPLDGDWIERADA